MPSSCLQVSQNSPVLIGIVTFPLGVWQTEARRRLWLIQPTAARKCSSWNSLRIVSRSSSRAGCRILLLRPLLLLPRPELHATLFPFFLFRTTAPLLKMVYELAKAFERDLYCLTEAGDASVVHGIGEVLETENKFRRRGSGCAFFLDILVIEAGISRSQ